MLWVGQNLWILFVHPPLEDWLHILNGIKIGWVSWPWTQNVHVLFHIVITFALWQGAQSCWKRYCSSSTVSWMVGRSCARRIFWYHSLVMAVFSSKFVSEPSPWGEMEPHTWMITGCFTVGITQDRWKHSSFLLRLFFPILQTIGKGIGADKMILVCFAESQSVPNVVDLFVVLLDIRLPRQQKLVLIVHADALIPAYWHFWANSALVVHHSCSWINFRRQ